MAKARAIIKRRKAVANIRKITQTMQLIATARFQKCLQRATAGKPYTNKLTEMIQTLAGVESAEHPLLQPVAGVERSVLLVITSNRGLCGAYNAAVLRAATERRKHLEQQGLTASIEMVGKKGVGYARFLGWSLVERITDVEDKIAYARVATMAERYMQQYTARQIARVDVAYTRFLSIGVQRATVAQLLPIVPPEGDAAKGGARPDFEFSPPPEILLARLIPESVKVRLYQYFNDSIVSEQVARMTAMKSATDAAAEMIKSLGTQYNRARQSQITMELADIVGGANAVEGK